ncbi:RHS repeat-associated core domain-containing protein, partial [Microbulbifer sp. 2205BS26-8]|uniref:RHS repeat-associated core domain-containing protein n=1 Tax=Microbulbifer sp. 2205BS26-8 TaxID=3064386 RepID=UPI00273E9FDC
GLIHMNGRIYDPRLGRFMQADPFIQAAADTQMYNRYSYVRNNPLNAADPSGYFLDKIFKGLNKLLGDFAPFVSIALLAIPGVGAWAAASWQKAFTFGFVTGGISSGSTRGAIIGGVSGAAFHGIGNKFTAKSGFFESDGLGHIATHATTGGVVSVLQGGKFGHGFFSAGLTKSLTPHIQGIGGDSFIVGGYNIAEATAAAIIGGTASKLTGGKFANGATTAALANILNNQSSRIRESEKAKNAQKTSLFNYMNVWLGSANMSWFKTNYAVEHQLWELYSRGLSDQWTPEKVVNAINNFDEFYHDELISAIDRINDGLSSQLGDIPKGAAQSALLGAVANTAVVSSVKSYGTIKDGANLMTAAKQIGMAIENSDGPYVMTYKGN